ncbi:hypothetical protein [Chamaesiphon minutus]|uniref:Uncharacterized protein n=1 Tax=Chamaesiphon minutus (strain ATCC 27169 / PCC 6605) TaxID=1173020 RepID=K9UHA1_CHAP6|nr:hypothetical protein [Chamaesiphon minutus]AFY94482.1 hypothetical protein Cha6605_3492 [Chamaesiphon minutus PCC 6605]
MNDMTSLELRSHILDLAIKHNDKTVKQLVNYPSSLLIAMQQYKDNLNPSYTEIYKIFESGLLLSPSEVDLNWLKNQNNRDRADGILLNQLTYCIA